MKRLGMFGSMLAVVLFAIPVLADDCKDCKTMKEAGQGWCSDCKAGLAHGLTIKSEKIYKLVVGQSMHALHGGADHAMAGHDAKEGDAKGHGEMAMACEGCAKAAHEDGFCEGCKVGFVKGQKFSSKVGYILAKGTPIPAVEKMTCESCKKTHEAGKPGYCEECKAGLVAGRFYMGKESFKEAVKAYDTLKTAVKAAEKCEDCGVATLTGGKCETCTKG